MGMTPLVKKHIFRLVMAFNGIQSRDFIGTAFRLQGGTVESTVFDVHVFHNDVAFGLGTP